MRTTLILAVFLTASFATAALTQTASKPAVKTVRKPAIKPAAKAAAPAYVDQGFAPGFDDLMTMLVQPRHIKLFYAGNARNWELAAAEARDLRDSLGRVAQAIPKYEAQDVALSMGNFVIPKLDAVDAAIAAADPGQFATAYKNLTASCNDCHTYMEHPYLVIKSPDPADAAYSDQDFNPGP